MESAPGADFRNRSVGLHDHLRGAHDAEPVDIGPEILAGVLLEIAAYRRGGHAHFGADVFERDFVVVVVFHELQDFLDAFVAVGLRLVIRRSDNVHFVRSRRGEVVEDVQKEHHRLESPQSGQLQQPVADAVHHLFGEMETCDGQAQHLLNGLQVLGFQELPVGHVAAELYRHGFAVDVGIGFVARVAVRNARKNDDQVLFGEVVGRTARDARTLDVQGQAQHVVLVEMQGRIRLFVGPVLRDEQVFFRPWRKVF